MFYRSIQRLITDRIYGQSSWWVFYSIGHRSYLYNSDDKPIVTGMVIKGLMFGKSLSNNSFQLYGIFDVTYLYGTVYYPDTIYQDVLSHRTMFVQCI